MRCGNRSRRRNTLGGGTKRKWVEGKGGEVDWLMEDNEGMYRIRGNSWGGGGERGMRGLIEEVRGMLDEGGDRGGGKDSMRRGKKGEGGERGGGSL